MSIFGLDHRDTQLHDTIRQLAEQDAAKGIYMGSEFISFRKQYAMNFSIDGSASSSPVFDALRLLYYNAYKEAKNTIKEQCSSAVEHSEMMSQFA